MPASSASGPGTPQSGVPSGSSFIATHLIDGLRDVMPGSEQAKLAPYAARAAGAGSDETAEWHRAYRCAQWATRTAAAPAHSSVAAELRRAAEVVKQIEETVGGEISNFFEIPYRQSVSPRFEAETTWVYEAVHVAAKVAEKVGWDAVGWEQLVEDVLTVPADGGA